MLARDIVNPPQLSIARCPSWIGRTTRVLPAKDSALVWLKGDTYEDGGTTYLQDKLGSNNRTIYPTQYIQADGTGYLAHDDLTATCTMADQEGTTTPTFDTDKVDLTSGTLWSFSITFDDATTSAYEFGSKTGASSGVVFDTTEYGRHLTMTSFVDYDTACASDDTCESGSDTLNLLGYTVADGTSQYLDQQLTELVPADTIIPALSDGSACCSYSWDPD